MPDNKVRRSLSEKHKLIYAPMSDVGGVMYDKDAVYIDVVGSFTKKNVTDSKDNINNNGDDNENNKNGLRMILIFNCYNILNLTN